MTRRNLLLLCAPASVALLSARPVRGAGYKARRLRASGAAPDSKAPATATQPVQTGPLVFELTAAERWPIRGLDPVLHVGAVTLDSYRYGNSENTVLIFTCYQPDALQEGATVFLQYGGDETSRTELPNFRWSGVQ